MLHSLLTAILPRAQQVSATSIGSRLRRLRGLLDNTAENQTSRLRFPPVFSQKIPEGKTGDRNRPIQGQKDRVEIALGRMY